MAVIPTAKALYLCEETDVEGGLTNLYGLFNVISPSAYPHTLASFVCFTQLVGGLGDVRVHIDIRRAADGRLIRNTNVQFLRFPDRATQRQLGLRVDGCVFDAPGVYLVELYCDNQWVADTSFRLREVDK